MDSKHFMMFSELFEQFRLQALMLLREAEEAGFIDELTNCYNRKAYAIRKGQLLGSSVAVLFCDINGLKVVNDTKGHKAGDVLLRDLAKMLKAYFGGNDVFRVGGDEFVILKANAKPEAFNAIVEEFKSAMEMHTTSVAVGCSMSSPDKSLDTAIVEAEQEMYSQKKYFHNLE